MHLIRAKPLDGVRVLVQVLLREVVDPLIRAHDERDPVEEAPVGAKIPAKRVRFLPKSAQDNPVSSGAPGNEKYVAGLAGGASPAASPATFLKTNTQKWRSPVGWTPKSTWRLIIF